MNDKKRGLTHRIPEGWHGISDVSKKTGIPLATLRRWHKTGDVIPSGRVQGSGMRLYSDQDIEAAIAYRNRPRT